MDNDDLVFAADQPAATIDRMVRRGDLVRLTAGVYARTTSGMSAEQMTRRHWPQVAGRLFPQAVITDRSARIRGPTDGVLYLAHQATRDRAVRLPGLTVLARHGLPPEQVLVVVVIGGAMLQRRRRSLPRALTALAPALTAAAVLAVALASWDFTVVTCRPRRLSR